MGEELKNGVVEEEEREEEVEMGGGLRTRTRRNRVVVGGGEVTEEVAGESAEERENGGGGEHEVCVYLDEEQGIESTDGTTQTKIAYQHVTDKNINNSDEDSTQEVFEEFHAAENHQHLKSFKAENQRTSFVYSKEHYGEESTGTKSGIEEHEQVTLTHKLAAVEIDLEKVLEEQETHDLYCPNCHSCITRRVILRKRKRISRDVQYEAKREKRHPVQANLVTSSATAETLDLDQPHNTGPDVFRCLSCLSFFIPTDTGFRLFNFPGKREENENLQSSQQIPAKSSNWMSSLLELVRGKKKGNEPGVPLLGESDVQSGHHFGDPPRKDEQTTLDKSISATVLPEKSQADNREELKDVAGKNDAGNGKTHGNAEKLQIEVPIANQVGLQIHHAQQQDNGIDVGDEVKVRGGKSIEGENNKQAKEKNTNVMPAHEDQIPVNHHTETEKDVKKADRIPAEEEETSQISLKQGALQPRELQINSGENLVNMIETKTSKNDTIQDDGTLRINLLHPSLPLEKDLSDVINSAAVHGVQLSLNFHNSIGKHGEHMEPDSLKCLQISSGQGSQEL